MIEMNKIKIISILTIIITSTLTNMAVWAAPQNATGLLKPTSEEEAWMAQNLPVIKNIKLNSIALERINQDRTQKGLNRLTAQDIQYAAIGNELSFTSTEMTGTTTAATTLPPMVDNSATTAFPPIRSQGGIGSCASWATTYYQYSYEVNLALGRDAKGTDGLGVNTNIFSPKWTYNMINGGTDAGSYFSANYNVLLYNGATTWALFPYDTNYLQWCTNPQAWRQALNYRATSYGTLYNSNVDTLLSDIKAQLANGHVLVIGTYVNSWVAKTTQNDPNTTDDDAYVGQYIASYMKNTNQGGHGMTIVGYNNALWTDLNGNGVVESAEKGAFKIANSWGTGDWNKGYRWVAYDSLRSTTADTATTTWPTNDRSSGIFWSGSIYTLTVSGAYQPTLVASVTLNQLKRGQIYEQLGAGTSGATTPTTTWNSGALTYSGGNYAFDGSTTAIDSTFYLDLTDLAEKSTTSQRWFLITNDATSGDPTTIKSFNLYQTTSSGDVLVGSSSITPVIVDGSQSKMWLDYTPDSFNASPISNLVATPTSGSLPLTVAFDGSASSDPDGQIVSYNWEFGDGSIGMGAQTSHIYSVVGSYTAKLTVTDDKGAVNSASVIIQVTDPNFVAAPTNLVAKVGRGTLSLTWKDNSNNEDGFKIEIATKTRSGYTAYTTLAVTTSAIWSGKLSANSYSIRVKAYRGTTYSAYSNIVNAKVR
jgi:C1A family cysteine protease/PKD repeat protein